MVVGREFIFLGRFLGVLKLALLNVTVFCVFGLTQKLIFIQMDIHRLTN